MTRVPGCAELCGLGLGTPLHGHRTMSLGTATGIALILSTLIYHGGIAYLLPTNLCLRSTA